MEARITFVTLGVSNFKKVKEFYMKSFGWKPMSKNPNIAFFKLNGMVLGLYPHKALAEDAKTKPFKSGFKGVTLAINFNSEKEVDKVFADLKKKKVKIVKSPQKVFWGGYSGYISDIEGNLWEIAYNPFLTMDKDGNVLGHA